MAQNCTWMWLKLLRMRTFIGPPQPFITNRSNTTEMYCTQPYKAGVCRPPFTNIPILLQLTLSTVTSYCWRSSESRAADGSPASRLRLTAPL